MKHGNYSVLELLWRVAMLRANLRENSFNRLVRSSAYDGLDPSEKGSVSFFVGIYIAKALSGRLFQVPWLLHLGVYKALLNPSFDTDDRPDFVGFDAANRSLVLEAKGRTRGITAALVSRAKDQTLSISTLNGVPPTARVAMLSYFSDRGLRVNVVDPPDPSADAEPLDLSPARLAHLYYRHLFEFVGTLRAERDMLTASVEGVELPGFDAKFQIDQDISRWYLTPNASFDDIRRNRQPAGGLALYPQTGEEHPEPNVERHQPMPAASNEFFHGSDGVKVVLGRSWAEELMRREPTERGSER